MTKEIAVCYQPVQNGGLPVTSYFLSIFVQKFKRVFNAPCVNTPRSLFTVAFTVLLPFIIYRQIGTAYPIKKWRWVQSTAVWFLLFAKTFSRNLFIANCTVCAYIEVQCWCSVAEVNRIPFLEDLWLEVPRKQINIYIPGLFLRH